MSIIAFSGRIGKDAETRTTQGGDRVTSFSVGCNVGRDKTQWIDCSIWGDRGDKLAPYLLKGTPVGVNGRPAVRAYLKDGEAVAVQQCMVNHVDLLGSKSDGDRASGNRDDSRDNGRSRAGSGPAPVDLGDDIPF
jgi:single-strand DNA-binding protein